jgi:hypothetical protein
MILDTGKFFEELLSHFSFHDTHAFQCVSPAEHANIYCIKNVLNESFREE